jgi:RNA polymerase sigma-70 factor (ECF subfamily)
MAFQHETALVAALTSGDEAAFVSVFENYHTSLLRVAKIYVSDADLAEEVAQETWIAVLKGLRRFEGRSSLKTWIFSIMVNRAKTYAQREGRYLPFSVEADDEPFEPAVAPDRFHPADSKYADHWISIPKRWDEIPESSLLSQEMRQRIQQAIDALPPRQREVITLRDVEQISSEDVCNILGVTETNQRVLLHRARAQVRRALENYLGE